MKSVLLISINSLHENTGGGLYLKCILNSYISNGCKVKLLCKNNKDNKGNKDNKNLEIEYLNKTFLTDLISRIFFCPSFLFFYFFKILFEVKKYDVISFHSSRLGTLIFLLRFFYPNKKIVCHFDNVESELIKQTPLIINLRGCLTLIDRLIIPFSESMAIKKSTNLSFITSEDLFYFDKNNISKRSSILPICLSSNNLILRNRNNEDRVKLLFTGSFSFFPNVDALKILIQLSNCYKEFDFYIAGRELERLNIKPNDNLFLFSDLSASELESLYLTCDVFISTVYTGSGMKTKLAEAMSYGLPIISDERSIAGYKEAINKGVIITFNDAFCKHTFSKNISTLLNIDKSYIYDVFKNNYSDEFASKVVKEILK